MGICIYPAMVFGLLVAVTVCGVAKLPALDSDFHDTTVALPHLILHHLAQAKLNKYSVRIND